MYGLREPRANYAVGLLVVEACADEVTWLAARWY